jgi:hypothetical protein
MLALNSAKARRANPPEAEQGGSGLGSVALSAARMADGCVLARGAFHCA